MSELVWQLERDLWYANEKIRMLELKVAKLKKQLQQVANVVNEHVREFNALYDVHGC